jgi:hypothetical protein
MTRIMTMVNHCPGDVTNPALGKDRSTPAHDGPAQHEATGADRGRIGPAAQPMPTELGTLDAIHLATALLWRDTASEPLTMAPTTLRLR